MPVDFAMVRQVHLNGKCLNSEGFEEAQSNEDKSDHCLAIKGLKIFTDQSETWERCKPERNH